MNEPPLDHHRRHARSFLDVRDDPERPRTVAHVWCLDCDYDVEVSDDEAERLADEGIPWRTGTE